MAISAVLNIIIERRISDACKPHFRQTANPALLWHARGVEHDVVVHACVVCLLGLAEIDHRDGKRPIVQKASKTRMTMLLTTTARVVESPTPSAPPWVVKPKKHPMEVMAYPSPEITTTRKKKAPTGRLFYKLKS